MNELNKRMLTSILLIILLLSMLFYNYIFIIGLLVIATIVWIEISGLFNKIFKDKFIKFLANFLALIYIFYFTWLSVEAFRYDNLKIIWQYSILICIMSDIGGYVFGKTFKGKKLTKISPNKTISGLIGAYIFSLLIMFGYLYIFDGDNLTKFLIITLTVSSTSQLGDIFISFIKRKAKVKHTSDILPGHGGILDRVDGMIFGIPIGLNLSVLI